MQESIKVARNTFVTVNSRVANCKESKRLPISTGVKGYSSVKSILFVEMPHLNKVYLYQMFRVELNTEKKGTNIIENIQTSHTQTFYPKRISPPT